MEIVSTEDESDDPITGAKARILQRIGELLTVHLGADFVALAMSDGTRCLYHCLPADAQRAISVDPGKGLGVTVGTAADQDAEIINLQTALDQLQALENPDGET